MSDLSSTAVVAIWTVVVIAAYIVGTFPSAVLVARANGVDITTAVLDRSLMALLLLLSAVRA